MSEIEIAKAVNRQTHDALQTVFDELNKGQQQKLLKNEEIKVLLEKFHVKMEDNSIE